MGTMGEAVRYRYLTVVSLFFLLAGIVTVGYLLAGLLGML